MGVSRFGFPEASSDTGLGGDPEIQEGDRKSVRGGETDWGFKEWTSEHSKRL